MESASSSDAEDCLSGDADDCLSGGSDEEVNGRLKWELVHFVRQHTCQNLEPKRKCPYSAAMLATVR